MLAPDRKKYLLFVSALVIALTIIRCPELLLSPRFFAEEGTTYFAGAYRNSFIGNIFSAHYGYYTLYNQLATSLARLAPLEHAPLVTTLMSLLLQVGISLYVLWGDIPLLDTPCRRTALALAIPLVSWPGHWLTIIGSHCWLGAGTFLLLLSSGRNGQVRDVTARGGYLVLAGLTGVVSCFMIPAYLWRAVRERSTEFFAYTGILLSCLLIQGGVLLAAMLSRSPEVSGRFMPNSIEAMLGKTVVYQFTIPFTGRWLFEQQSLVQAGFRIRSALENILGVEILIHDLFMIPILVGLGICAMTAFIIWKNRFRLEIQLIAVALVTVSILSNICSINSTGGPRYYFIPSLMLLTLYICTREMKNCRPVAMATALLVLTTLLANGLEYRAVMAKQAYNPDYPDWREEVETWKNSPSYRLSIWPSDWKITLDRRPGRSDT